MKTGIRKELFCCNWRERWVSIVARAGAFDGKKYKEEWKDMGTA